MTLVAEAVNTLSSEACWQAVLARDRAARFVYAVRSTGIFCRPSCPSKRPGRAQVAFFAQPAQAAQGGFRACKRCRPDGTPWDAAAIVRAVQAVLDQQGRTSLAELSRKVGLSAAHLQRTFKKETGLSPQKYAEALRLGKLRRGLRAGETVTDAMLDAGYGSTSRLYDGGAERLGMTPSAYRAGGQGEVIAWDCAAVGDLGHALVGSTGRGVCAISLGASEDELAARLLTEFPKATLRRDPAALAPLLRAIEEHLRGSPLTVPLDLRATAFQVRVWEALRRIPRGETRTYSELARALGTGPRAIARACASNKLALAIPCHRVIRETGALGGYRWGLERKGALLARERK